MANDTQSPNPAARKPLTAERLRELLHYDPSTGEFTWDAEFKWTHRAGKRAGCYSDGDEYVKIGIDSRLYKAHQLAWLYMTGGWAPMHIDHKDGDGKNNRWGNLRLATRLENRVNSKTRSDNVSGLKGVSAIRGKNRWVARIMVRGKMYNLGYFKDPEVAHEAYCAAASRYFGEFARFG